MNNKLRFETQAIQSTAPHGDNTGSVANAIYPSTTFAREIDGSYHSGFVYTRDNNPNRQLLEDSINTLEKGKQALAFASGMAAASAVLQSLCSGDHVLLPDDAYYCMHRSLREVYSHWGLQHSLVDMTDLDAVRDAMQNNTRLVWLESPSNPLLKVSDIAALAEIAHQNQALCVVDNTWATPVLQRPLDLGADAVMYSTTKYFGGHSDSLSGALVLNRNSDDAWLERLQTIQKLNGAVPSPFDCWLILRGLKTMKLRLQQQTSNARQLAEFLVGQSGIQRVHYPSLDSHPQHLLTQKQMPFGCGAMLSVEYGKNQQQAMQLIGRLGLFTAATSLGGVESLIEHRKSVEGPLSATPENLLRISVGIEHIEDLKEDWRQALKV